MKNLKKMKHYRFCVAIILKKEKKIFFALRADIKNAWQLPQGGVENSETFLDAAKRELFEETGVVSCNFIKETEKFFLYNFSEQIKRNMKKKYGHCKYDGQKMKFVLFEFFGDESEINLNNQTPQEFLKWKWEKPSEILMQIVDFKRPIYKQAFLELGLI